MQNKKLTITMVFLSLLLLILAIGTMGKNETFALSKTFSLKEGFIQDSKEVKKNKEEDEIEDNKGSSNEDDRKDEEEKKDIVEEEPVRPAFKTAGLEELISYSVPEGKVALTFDDGPSKYTIDIMETLRDKDVGGTFFFIGQHIKEYPDHVKEVHANGYSVGSHSMGHKNLRKLSRDKQKHEIIDSIKMIEKIVGDNISLFRAPFGNYNSDSEKILKDNKYKMVMWNNDPMDWKVKDSKKIYKEIIKHDLSGAIILLHETQETLDMLPKLLKYIEDQGLEIVGLD